MSRAFLFIVLLPALATFASEVRVDNFYDNSDDARVADLMAANRAIRAAGVGGTVLFTGGKTYDLPSHLEPLDSQTLTSIGIGKATLRRSDAIETTLVSSAIAGQNILRVENPHAFERDWWISPLVSNGTGARSDGEPLLTRIVAIVGDRIILNRPLSKTYNTGDRIVNTPRVIHIAGSDIEISNLQIDGNKINNDNWVSWASHMDVHFSHVASGAILRDVDIKESTGTPLYIQSTNTAINNVTLENSNLSCAHFSTAESVVIENTVCKNANGLGHQGGHSSSAFEWSLFNNDITIRDSTIVGTTGYAFGALFPYGGNTDVRIEGNTISNNDGVLRGSVASNTVGRSLQLQFSDNLVQDSGVFLLTSPSNDPILDINISDNLWRDSHIRINGIDQSAIEGNVWFGPAGATEPQTILIDEPGADFVLANNRLSSECDLDESQSCDVGDLDLIVAAIARGESSIDFDDEGSTGPLHSSEWLTLAGFHNGLDRPYDLGDVNLDGIIGGIDLGGLLNNFNMPSTRWSEGELNGDGIINSADLGLLLNNFGAVSAAAAPVPETIPQHFLICFLLIIVRNSIRSKNSE